MILIGRGLNQRSGAREREAGAKSGEEEEGSEGLESEGKRRANADRRKSGEYGASGKKT